VREGIWLHQSLRDLHLVDANLQDKFRECRQPFLTERAADIQNLADEKIDGVPRAELWVDVAEGIGADRQSVKTCAPIPVVKEFMFSFRSLMESPASALAAYYAYEVAAEKQRKTTFTWVEERSVPVSVWRR